MPPPPSHSTLLITGASGFIATHTALLCLTRGFRVIGTVRSASKGDYLISLFRHLVPGAEFEYRIVPDIASSGAFDEALKDARVEAVLHTASPFHWSAVEPEELTRPAVEGTLNLLRSIQQEGQEGRVKRVVLTSSVAAVVNASVKAPHTFAEGDWNTESEGVVSEKGRDADNSQKYKHSKTQAERAAWKFVEDNKPSWDLCTVNPVMVFGPIIHQVDSPDKLNTSVQTFHKLIQGSTQSKDLPGPVANGVDVREVAEAHLNALEIPAAGGERFITCAGPYTAQTFVEIMAKIDPSLKLPQGEEGAAEKAVDPSNWPVTSGQKAVKVLGIKYRSYEDTLRDMYESLKLREEKKWGQFF